MRKYLIALSALAIVTFGCSQSKKKTKKITKESLETNLDKAAYSIGLNIAENFKSQGIDLDLDILQKGLEDGLNEEAEKFFDEQEIQVIMTQFQQDMRAKLEEKQKAEAEEGKKYLEENSKKEGIITLPSGLQYKVLKEGNGPIATASQKVECHYEGRLINGEVFDSSYKRGEPAQFGVTQVIKGWTEALQIMPVGSKWQLFIPSELGYGPRGSGPKIGPNATLIFDIELLKIVE